MFRHRFDVWIMLRVFEQNVNNPAFAQQKNSFFEELKWHVHFTYTCVHKYRNNTNANKE